MPEENISGITKIAVKGFKSIAEECEIDIRPLTILAGANSSGKSSIMQPLLLLKQTLEAPYDPGPLLIDGPNVRFTSTSQFLSTLTDKKTVDSFQVKIDTRDSDYSNSMALTFRSGQRTVEIIEMTCEEKLLSDKFSPTEHLTLAPQMTSEEIRSIIEQHSIPKDFNIVKRLRCFLVFGSQDSEIIYIITPKVESNIFNIIYLPGLRGNPERIYRLTSSGPLYPGTFEHYASSVIHEWQETKSKQLNKITDSLHILGLTAQVSTQQIGNIGVEVQVSRLPHDSSRETDTVNIADVGFGVSQVLPVVVALIAAKPRQLVYLEQPELHLHPNAQVKLAQVLADAAKRGVRVVAETHSSLLLLGIQTLVAEGKLSPELVKLHWFSRNKEGITKVDSVDLDEAGTYGEWPVDFNDVSLNVQSRYIKASRSRFIEGT
ncbi:AAA family ATPase [Candidatus Poribacteria bacterium]|nr:AAA family ATPase [Candidatus Poribacteria bacterium]